MPSSITLAPLSGVVGTVAGSLDAIIDHALAPVVGTVGAVAEPLGATVEHLATPLLLPVGDLVGSVASTLAPAVFPLTDIGEHVLQPAAALAGETVAPLTSSIEPIIAPLADAVAPILQPLGAVVGPGIAPLADALDLQGIVGSAGNIVLPELPIASAVHLDDLFSNGNYTSYNLALNVGQSGPATPTTNIGTSLGATTNIVGDVHADVGAHDDHNDAAAPHGIIAHLADDLHLRGFGDGIAL